MTFEFIVKKSTNTGPMWISGTRNSTRLSTYLVGILFLVGCLRFGDDIETTSPSQAQIARSVAEMYIDPELDIVPVGMVINDSGIDSIIWFKFRTTVKPIEDIFLTSIVDTTTFEPDFVIWGGPKTEWWEPTKSSLIGGQISLPNARFMNVGIESTKEELIVYIIWHET